MAESNEDPGTATYQEIISQPQAWAEAITIVAGQANRIKQLYAPQRYDDVLFTGCGSTYYLSLAAASLWQTLFATPARAVPAGELFLNPEAIYGPEPTGRTLLVAVSRSGTTTETITATRQFKARSLGDVIVVTNYDDTPLAALGDLVIAIPAGQEESVAQTRSFASMYVALTALISTLMGQCEVGDGAIGYAVQIQARRRHQNRQLIRRALVNGRIDVLKGQPAKADIDHLPQNFSPRPHGYNGTLDARIPFVFASIHL